MPFEVPTNPDHLFKILNIFIAELIEINTLIQTQRNVCFSLFYCSYAVYLINLQTCLKSDILSYQNILYLYIEMCYRMLVNRVSAVSSDEI